MTNEQNIYKENGFYKAKDVMAMLDCKKSKAYEVIKMVNDIREKNNLLVIRGMVPARDFNKQFSIEVV